MDATKSHLALRCAFLLVMLPVAQAAAAFSSLYAFGDGVCTTTDNEANLPTLYHEKRYCNGRVWIEVLCEWQGITYNAGNNLSYYGHDSAKLVTNTNNFAAPADAATALFVVWCNNADFVLFAFANNPPYSSGNIPAWTTFINQSITRHTQAVTTLYNKGARTLVMPKACDISATPAFDLTPNDSAFIRNRAIQFNLAFDAAMTTLASAKPGLVIHRPDTFTFFEQVLVNPGAYGLINPGIDALTDLGNPSMVSGPGTTYIFWDDLGPTAKFQMHLAELVQQLISPVKVTSLTRTGSTAQLVVGHVPLQREGFVEGCGALLPPWQPDTSILVPFTSGGSTTSTITFSAPNAKRFYRVAFPVVWTWP